MKFLDLFPTPDDQERLIDDLCDQACEYDGLIDVRDFIINSWLINMDQSVFELLGTTPEDPALMEDVGGYTLHTSSETECTFRSLDREEPDEYSTHTEVTAEGPEGSIMEDSGTDDAGGEAVWACCQAIVKRIVEVDHANA